MELQVQMRERPGRHLEAKKGLSWHFTSKELDEETGLYYYGARYYEPATSRWISPDPAGFELINPMDEDGELRADYSVIEALNWYAYVSNNPVKYVDPAGMEKEFFVGYTPVLLGIYHTTIFWEDDETGEAETIVEGYPENRVGGEKISSSGDWGNLVKEEGKGQTELDDIKKRDSLPVPEGMDPEEFLGKLEDAADSYDDSVPYKAIPRKKDDSGNSNSLTGNVLREAGSNYEPSRFAPGWDKDVLPPSPEEQSVD